MNPAAGCFDGKITSEKMLQYCSYTVNACKETSASALQTCCQVTTVMSQAGLS
jgi:hypothetical protein